MASEAEAQGFMNKNFFSFYKCRTTPMTEKKKIIKKRGGDVMILINTIFNPFIYNAIAGVNDVITVTYEINCMPCLLSLVSRAPVTSDLNSYNQYYTI